MYISLYFRAKALVDTVLSSFFENANALPGGCNHPLECEVLAIWGRVDRLKQCETKGQVAALYEPGERIPSRVTETTHQR